MRLLGEKRNRRRNSALSTGEIQPRTYDDNGNLTAKTDNVTDLTYDAAGNLLTVTDNDSSLSFTYDDANRRLTASTLAAGIQPVVTQVGVIDLTFTVSDGFLLDSEAITITVTGTPAGTPTALSGTVRDAGAADPDTAPLEGITVSVGAISTTTDANGDFTLTGLPSGSQLLEFDASTVSNPPVGVSYADFEEEFIFIFEVTNFIDRPFFLPRIDEDSRTTVVAGMQTTVINPNIGVTLIIAPDAAKDEQGNPFTGDITISEVPLELAPVELPAELQPAILITIQPVGVTFDPPAQISFPNRDNLPTGTRTELWSLDPDRGRFQVVGVGSATATTIDTISGGVRTASWHAPLTVPADSDTEQSDIECMKIPCKAKGIGSDVTVETGGLTVDHSFASYRSLEQARGVRLIYNILLADPQPIITGTARVQAQSALPNTLSARLSVAGVDRGTALHTGTVGLNENADEEVRQAVQFDASAMPTGLYPYRLTLSNNYNISSVSRVIDGNLLLNNQEDSPFGAGWTLDGLSRLHLGVPDIPILTEGDGSILRFTRDSRAFGNPADFGSFVSTRTFAIDDFNGDGRQDLAVPDFGPGTVVIMLSDINGGFPTSSSLPADISCQTNSDCSALAVATGNFNTNIDTIRDLAVATGSGISILLGTAGGNFAAAIELDDASDTIPLTRSIAIGDFNLDGHDDIAALSSRTVNVFFGDGTGAFPTRKDVDVTIAANFQSDHSLKVDDFNGDNIPDIAVHKTNNSANPQRNVAVILLGDGKGDFVRREFSAGLFGGGDRGVDSADFDGDGDKDLVFANAGSSTVSVLWNDGTGGFATLSSYSTASPPDNVAVGDFNSDGNPDIVTANGDDFSSRHGISILLGDGKRGFSRHISETQHNTFTTGKDGGTIGVGDFNGDGTADIAHANTLIDRMTIRIGVPGTVTTFRGPPADFSILTDNGDGTFTRTMKDGIRINFDAQGLQTAIIDRNGNTTAYVHDGNGLLQTITDPMGLATNFVYAGGKLSSITDPAARVTNFSVDGNGDLVRITDADTSFREFSYDARHRLVANKSKRGFDTTYDYNFAGRVTQVNRPDITATRPRGESTYAGDRASSMSLPPPAVGRSISRQCCRVVKKPPSEKSNE